MCSSLKASSSTVTICRRLVPNIRRFPSRVESNFANRRKIYVVLVINGSHGDKRSAHIQESDPEMATASQQRPLPLLRRPLPPKQEPPASSFRPGSAAKYSQTDGNYKVSAKSPDVLSAKRLVNVKSTKVVDSTLREVRFHGDVPLPVSSVVKPYKTKGPDPLPPRPPRKPRELPTEAFIKDSYTRPPPEFTLKHFLRRLPSRANPDDDVEPMVSEQNYEKLTSWFAANKPHQATVHSLEIDSK